MLLRPHWASYVLPNIVCLQLVNLESLGADQCALIARLVSLQKLSLAECFRAPGPVPSIDTLSALSALSNLRRLCLHGSPEVPGLVAAFGSWFQLTKLRLTGFALSDLRGVELHTRLVSCSLNACSLAEIPGSLCTLSQLQQLHLEQNNLSQLPDSISGLSGLRVLQLHHNAFRVFPDLQLAVLTMLESLDISFQDCFEDQFINHADYVTMGVPEPVTCFLAMPRLKLVDLRQYAGYVEQSEECLNVVVDQLDLSSMRGERACRPVILYRHFAVSDVVQSDTDSDDDGCFWP